MNGRMPRHDAPQVLAKFMELRRESSSILHPTQPPEMSRDHNTFLDAANASASDSSSVYDSEAAAPTKGSRARRSGGRSDHAAKRRKTSQASSSEDGQDGRFHRDVDSGRARARIWDHKSRRPGLHPGAVQRQRLDESCLTGVADAAGAAEGTRREEWEGPSGGEGSEEEIGGGLNEDEAQDTPAARIIPTKTPTAEQTTKTAASRRPTPRPGVIYLSSLPPYLKPSALRNLLQQRGFGPITRLFLAPATHSRSSGRKLYIEGWLEFASHRTAKLCAQTLNATPVGGKKGGFYRDDVWNMRYLKGMAWEGLMEGVRGEQKEAEARRDEERRVMRREDRVFVEGVERSKRERTRGEKARKRKRKGEDESLGQDVDVDVDVDVKRTWRQYVSRGKGHGASTEEVVPDDVKKVLAKIFY